MSENWRLLFTSIGKVYGVPAGDGKYTNLMRALEQMVPVQGGGVSMQTMMVPLDPSNPRRKLLINMSAVIAQATLDPKDDAQLIKELEQRINEICAARAGLEVPRSPLVTGNGR